MKRCSDILIAVCGLALLGGCQIGPSAERFGKTIFLDGAGNWGDGAQGVANGLFAAGYQGDVEEYVWTTSFNPLVDQLNIPAAKARSTILARKIKSYRERFPDAPLNVVALSAGTGVATWAIEQLNASTTIDNFVLLGSSLSHDYDMSRALAHLTGKVYVYYSPHDVVLDAVRTIGTIDGKRGVESAGFVGLTAPDGMSDRIINVEWSREWLKYGWTGAHQDCVNANFVRFEIARHLLSDQHSPRLAGQGMAPNVQLTSHQWPTAVRNRNNPPAPPKQKLP